MDNIGIETDLRIGSVQRGKKITLTVDGKPVTAYEGETVHAALVASGIQILGTTRKTHQNRGILCGMGICYQCRVEINGIPDQRACVTQVKGNMDILTHKNESHNTHPDMAHSPGKQGSEMQGEIQ
ncbi:MAG: (2Fe-2S)-binding protein [Desulfobacterium sp.]